MSIVAELDVLGKVLQLIESTLQIPADDVDIDANMEDFGVNSLIVMELMENIENKFDLTLTPAQFSNIDTVRGLAELLESLLEEGEGDESQVATDIPAPESVEPAGPASSAPQSSQSRDDSRPSRRVLDYIRDTFAVDLSGREFDSIEEVADLLVSNHVTDLMRHYGLDHPDTSSRQIPVFAIVGMSCRMPDAPELRTFWDNLLERKNSIREIPKSRWDWEAYYSETIAPGKTVSKWGALIDDVECFDATFFGIPAEEAATIDPQLRLLIEETYHAVEDAGIDVNNLAGSRTGVFVGYEYSEYEQRLRQLDFKDINEGPLFSSSSPSYYLSNRISHTFDLCGPSESFNVNCASSAVAVNRAYWSLSSGECDLAIAGAVSLNLFADDYIAASQYGVLSPDGTSGVFDDDANGFTRGEGVGTVVLKRLADAERDNDRIYGVIRSCYENFRGATRNISEVKHEAFTDVIKGCYKRASVDPASIDYIEVDGYANKWADSFEYEGIKGVFEKTAEGKKHVALGSVKGNIGNVESVSGVTSVIKLALSLYNKRFPATISKKKINTFIDIDSAKHPLYIADEEIPFEAIRENSSRPIRAGVNSFADSGTNVHILLEEYMSTRTAAPDPAASKQLFVLSGKDSKRLEEYVQRYIDFLSTTDISEPLADLAYTAQIGREALNHRLAIVATSRQDLLDKLQLVRRTGIKDKLGLDSKAIYYGKAGGGDKGSLADLITADMARMQLTQGLESGKWREVALLWVNGVAMPWEVIWRGKSVRRVSLPTYPFAKERHWLDVELNDAPSQVIVSSAASAAEEVSKSETEKAAEPEWYFYVPSDPGADQFSDTSLNRVDKIELFLRQEVARKLQCGIDDVALDRDFMDLGLDSMGVADLIFKVDKLLGCNLSPNVLFQHPEVSALSTYLAETYADGVDSLVVSNVPPEAGDTSQIDEAQSARTGAGEPVSPPEPPDIVVPLQKKGDKRPIFAIPGAGGNALSMQQLSHSLGEKQPFYCLEPVGLDGQTPPMTDVNAMAEFNVEAMRSVNPQGPYRLLGYSNGGIVAFEMARQLLEQGKKVASLIMLDTLAPSLLNRESIEVMTVQVFNRFVASLGGESDLEVGSLQQIPDDERSEYLYHRIIDLGLELPKQQFVATFNVATASERGCRAYQPQQLTEALDVTLLRATESFKGMPADYGWGEFLAGEMRVRGVRADHFTIIEKGPVERIAKHINTSVGKKAATRASRDRAQVTA